MTLGFDPAPYNEKYENGHVDNEDFKVFKIKDIITEQQLESIYDHVSKDGAKFMLQEFAGHVATTFYDEHLEKHLNDIVSKHIGESMVLKEYSYARYSNKFGFKPKLFPHFDTHYADGQRVTVDIQLRSNVPWAVIVEGTPYFMAEREALIFSGTQQIHWRQNKTLKDSDSVDMLFAHFEYKNNRPWSQDQKEILEYRSHRFREKTGISNMPEPIDYPKVDH